MSTVDIAIPGDGLRVRPVAIFLFLLVPFLAVAAGYRWFGEGIDYPNYILFWDQLSQSQPFAGVRFEPGFVWSAWFAKFYLDWDYGTFSAVLVALALFLKLRLILRRCDAPGIASICYFMAVYPLDEYTQLRAAVGMGFAYTAVDGLLDRKYLRAVILTALGMAFHYTAFVPPLLAVGIAATSRRSLGPTGLMMIGGSIVVGLFARYALPTLIGINPTLLNDLSLALGGKPLPFLRGENVRIIVVIIVSAIFQRPWRRDADNVYFCLSAAHLAPYIAFASIPVFATRLAFLFQVPLLLYPFRFDQSLESRIPTVFVVGWAVWALYNSIIGGQVAF